MTSITHSTAQTAVARARTVAFHGHVLQVEAVAAGVVKIRRAAAGAAEPPSPAVIGAVDEAAPACWTERDGRLALEVGPLTAEVHLASGLVEFRETAGGSLVAEIAAGVTHAEGPQSLAFTSRAEEHFYGLGQKIRGVDDTSLSWKRRTRTFGTYGNVREKSCPDVRGQGNGNTTVPLLLSSAGYGLFLDNHYRHEWDFTADDRWTVRAAQGEHRYYLIYGPDAATILERYTQLTGRPPLPPRWALGLLQSKFGYRNWDEVHAAADAYRAAGIPADAIVLDLYWFGGVPHFGGARRIGSLEWDRANFPDPARHIAALRAQGFKTVVIEEPYVDEALPAFREAAEGKHLATLPSGEPAILEKWWGRGGLVDMTAPATREWWWSRHRPLVADGVAGWWIDLGEPDTFAEDGRYAGGQRHADVHNRYALEWTRALAEGEARDRPERRPFILTRSGYAGIQRYGAAFWSNDVMATFEWLTPQIAAGLNLGLSAIPYWGTDVGGFVGPVASDELYVRWFQFGAFSPIFRPHGQDRPTAPFEFSPRVEAICRRYARLRYRLLPYIYTAAREAHDTGLPLMRALPVEFPEDPVVPDLGAEYLFGPSLLVAPVTGPEETRNIYLPPGEWVDFWTHTVYTGPTWLRNFPAPLDTLPLFVRAGAILPLAPDMAYTDERPLDELTLRVYPGRLTSSYTLYEDDGASNAYRDGAFARTRITCAPGGNGVRVDVAPAEGRYPGMMTHRTLALEIVLPTAPAQVRWNDAAAVWSWDQSNHVLHIRGPRAPVHTAQRVEVTPGPDAGFMREDTGGYRSSRR